MPIYLVDADPTVAQDMAVQLAYVGYDVSAISQFDELAAAVAGHLPAAIMTELRFDHGLLAGADGYFTKPIDMLTSRATTFCCQVDRGGPSRFFDIEPGRTLSRATQPDHVRQLDRLV